MLVMLVLGVVSLRSDPLSRPAFATAQFKRFFDCGRAVGVYVAFGSWSVSCIWSFCTVIKVQMLIVSNLL